jgi:hypothetical protein
MKRTIRQQLEALPKLHTSVIAGKPVTRWSELYEVGTYAKVENLASLDETEAKLVAAQ